MAAIGGPLYFMFLGPPPLTMLDPMLCNCREIIYIYQKAVLVVSTKFQKVNVNPTDESDQYISTYPIRTTSLVEIVESKVSCNLEVEI